MNMKPTTGLILFGLSVALVPASAAEDSAALQLFEERIMPIFRSEKPSSCVQCHLSSVDIKDYIFPSATKTFVALRDQGLVNVDAPDSSKILTLIKMGDKDQDAMARRIHENTRVAEFEAFSAWIKACSNDPAFRDLAIENLEQIGPDKPLEVVRHARKSRVAESFARNVWSQRMRCFPCHTPHELDPDNPKHKVGIKRHADLVKKFGQRMNIFRQSPEATMNQLISSSRRTVRGRYPLINLKDPAKSLLILKPTAKLPPKNDAGEFEKPSSADPVSHMGGLKMHVNDQSYKSFVAWIEDYANIVDNRYLSVDELPADNWMPTKRILRLRDAPEDWGNLTPVQMFVYAKEGDRWSTDPIAFTQSLTTPRRMVNGPLSLFRSESGGSNEDRAFPLKPGSYLIKAYVDKENRLEQDPTILLPESDFVGQAVIDAQWREGFPKAQVFSAGDLEKE